MRFSIFVSCAWLLATFNFAAAAEWSSEDTPFVEETAKNWEIGAPNLQITSGNSAFADKGGGITIGRGLIEHISSRFPQAAQQSTALRFIAAHELWHLRQFAEGQTNDGSTYPECEADVMAAYVVSTAILRKGSGSPSDAELRELLASVATLRDIPKTLAGLSQRPSVERTGWHLGTQQRDIAIHFGLARGGYDWGKAHPAAAASGLMKQYIDYTSRFVAPTLSARASASKLCRHVARNDVVALGSLTVFASMGSIDINARNPRQQWKVNVRNSSDRPIRYSFIGLSGYTNGEVKIYLDSSWNSVELLPGESRVVETTLLWPGSAASNASDIFTWTQPLEKDALVSAEYIGPPNVQSCARAMASSPPQSEIVQALLRIGDAAAERFVSLRSISLETNTSGPLDSFQLDVPLTDASPKALLSSDGSALATISFPESDSLESAMVSFNKLVNEIRTACMPFLQNVRVETGADGLPRFSISRLTSRSSAFLSISKMERKDAPLRYQVIWFISPRLPPVS